MKFYSGEFFEYVDPTNLSWRSPKRYSSVDETIKEAKEMEKRQIANGYTPSAWIIVKTSWNRCFEDDGSFVSESQGTIKLHIDNYLEAQK